MTVTFNEQELKSLRAFQSEANVLITLINRHSKFEDLNKQDYSGILLKVSLLESKLKTANDSVFNKLGS